MSRLNKPERRSRRGDDRHLDEQLRPDDPATEIVAAARGPATTPELTGLGDVLLAYRSAGPQPGTTAVRPAVARRKDAVRLLPRLAAASLATKIAFVTGAAVAAAAGSIAVTSVVEHRPQHHAPVASVAPSPDAPPHSVPGATAAPRPPGSTGEPAAAHRGAGARKVPGAEKGKHPGKSAKAKKPKLHKKHKAHKHKKPKKQHPSQSSGGRH